MTRIGITGATGVLARRFKSLYPDYEYSNFKGRLENFNEVREFTHGLRGFDALLHFGGLVSREIVENNPFAAFNSNELGTINVLESLRLLDETAPLLIFASTSHVFASSETPLNEMSRRAPSSTYGFTKFHAENWCEIYEKTYGLQIACLRLFNFTDVNQNQEFFIPAMIQKIRRAERSAIIELAGLTGFRDFLSAEQVSRVVNKVILKNVTGYLNVGTGEAIQLGSIVEEIKRILKREDVQLQLSSDHKSTLFADTSKLETLGIILKSEISVIIDQIISTFNKKD
jgi:nucleoside-diphosphate-sugar epimerase